MLDKTKYLGTMCKKFLIVFIILLTCITIVEIGYFSYLIIRYYKELQVVDLVITTFINFSATFFTAVLILGVAQSKTALLRVWIVYAILELSRSVMTVYDTWAEPNDNNFDRVSSSCDAGLQLTLLIVVFIFHHVIKDESVSLIKISSIGRSIELNDRNPRES